MIRALTITALLMTGVIPAIAQDNNPFSGATSISVEMTRDVPPVEKRALQQKRIIPSKSQHPFRLRCTLNGKPVADWRGKRVKLGGEWSDVPDDAAGPMLVLLWAGGARCR